MERETHGSCFIATQAICVGGSLHDGGNFLHLSTKYSFLMVALTWIKSPRSQDKLLHTSAYSTKAVVGCNGVKWLPGDQPLVQQ